jgi:phospholipase C
VPRRHATDKGRALRALRTRGQEAPTTGARSCFFREALIHAVKQSPNWSDTAIIITYDEHGGFWDHVAPPAGDKWGPGSRVPTIVISPFAKTGFVDKTPYNTLSILATIEQRWGLNPLTDRDRNAKPLLTVFK